MQVSVVAATVLFMSAIVLVTGKDEKKVGSAAPGERPQAGLIDEAVDSVAVDALFTAREAEVFALLVQGKTKRSISREVVLSENTVKTHIGKIYRKLGIHSQQELIHFVEQRAAVARHPPTLALESFEESMPRGACARGCSRRGSAARASHARCRAAPARGERAGTTKGGSDDATDRRERVCAAVLGALCFLRLPDHPFDLARRGALPRGAVGRDRRRGARPGRPAGRGRALRRRRAAAHGRRRRGRGAVPAPAPSAGR